jgi:hypothetical protein
VGWTVPPLPGPTGTVAFSVDGKTVGMKQLPAAQPGDSTTSSPGRPGSSRPPTAVTACTAGRTTRSSGVTQA